LTYQHLCGEALVALVLVLCACGARPTGISGVVHAAGREQVQVRVVTLYRYPDLNPPVFVEREAVFDERVDVGERFEVQARPGDYVVKVLTLEGDPLDERKIVVRRNRLTRLEFTLAE